MSGTLPVIPVEMARQRNDKRQSQEYVEKKIYSNCNMDLAKSIANAVQVPYFQLRFGGSSLFTSRRARHQ